MLKRLSQVKKANVTTLAFSSHFLIGDSHHIDAFSRTIALQREQELFFGNEENFNQYPVFTKPIFLPPLDESVIMIQRNQRSTIFVEEIEITGVTTASVLQIGSNHIFYGENRRKHIRHLLGNEQEKNGNDS